MKRWIAAFVAVLFLATATLHVFAHVGEADGDCSVCQVHASTLPALPAPRVVVVTIVEFTAPSKPVRLSLPSCVVSVPARAPPALLA